MEFVAGEAHPLQENRELVFEPAVGVEARGENHVVAGLVPVQAQLLGLVEECGRVCFEGVVESVVTGLCEKRGEGETADDEVFDVVEDFGETKRRKWGQLKQKPRVHQLRSLKTK